MKTLSLTVFDRDEANIVHGKTWEGEKLELADYSFDKCQYFGGA